MVSVARSRNNRTAHRLGLVIDRATNRGPARLFVTYTVVRAQQAVACETPSGNAYKTTPLFLTVIHEPGNG